jgi:hypothetical protein
MKTIQELYNALIEDSNFYNDEECYHQDYCNQKLTDALTSEDEVDFIAEFDDEFYLLETNGYGGCSKINNSLHQNLVKILKIGCLVKQKSLYYFKTSLWSLFFVPNFKSYID